MLKIIIFVFYSLINCVQSIDMNRLKKSNDKLFDYIFYYKDFSNIWKDTDIYLALSIWLIGISIVSIFLYLIETL